MQYVERASTTRSGDTHASGKMLSSAHDLFFLCLPIQHILCATHPISSPTKMRCVRAHMRVRAWDVHVHVHFFPLCVLLRLCVHWTSRLLKLTRHVCTHVHSRQHSSLWTASWPRRHTQTLPYLLRILWSWEILQSSSKMVHLCLDKRHNRRDVLFSV